MYPRKITLFLILIALISSCTDKKENISNITPADTQTISNISSVGYTYHRQDGNRLVDGSGNINRLTPIDVPLTSTAKWIAAADSGDNSSYWVAVLSDGEVEAFKVDAQGYEEVAITPSSLSVPVPPTLVVENKSILKLANIYKNASLNTSAVVLNVLGDRAYIADNGDIVLIQNNIEQRISVNALPYARILLDENNRLLVLGSPTQRYGHKAVLGSNYDHASTISIIETIPDFKVTKTIVIDSPDVVEGNALIWSDVDNDGQREIITTLSRTDEGGRLVIFNEDGTVKSESQAIGQNFRWRHQIAVAPFISNSQLDLLSVYIPHISPAIEIFRLDDESMNEDRQPVSYSSHLSTGLNIDMSLVGDFDGDEKFELLLVNRITKKEIGAFEYLNGSITLDWRILLKDSITSNVAAVTLPNNKIAFGVGQGNSLRIWHP